MMRAMTEFSIEGGCLCGAVRFVLTAPPIEAGYCHCTRCQRRTGTAASAQARIDGDALTLLAGAESVRGWVHSDGGMEKCFCVRCGTQLFARVPGQTAPRIVRMSAFDAHPEVRPSYRQYVDYAASWEPIPDDGLARFGEARPLPQA